MKPSSRGGLPILPILVFLLLLPGAALFAESPEDHAIQVTKSPGQYRGQGRYRSADKENQHQKGTAWKPMTYQQSQYYQVLPGHPYQGLSFDQSYSVPYYVPPAVRPHLVAAPIIFYPTTLGAEPAPPQSAQASPNSQPQIYIVQPPAPSPAPPPAPTPAPATAAATPTPAAEPPPPSEVLFSIRPQDATVAIDGRRVGTAAEVASLTMKAGVYVLEITHPSHPSQRLVFGVSGERLLVTVDLAADPSGQRAWVEKADASPAF